MQQLQITQLESTEITSWDFEQLKSELEQRLNEYKEIVYTDDNIKSAKDDRTTLNKAKKLIEDCRKAYKAKCLAPYEAMEPQIKELVAMIESQRVLIDDTVKDYENKKKQEKEVEVRKYYDKKAFVLGELAEPLYEKLLDSKWLNASTTKAKYEEGIQTAINNALNDINEIKSMESPFVDTLLEEYVRTLSVEQVKTKNDELITSMNKAVQSVSVAGIAEQSVTAEQAVLLSQDSQQNPNIVQSAITSDLPVGKGEISVNIQIVGYESEIKKVYDFMKMLGITYKTQ